ncbi:unnamed protein product [Urochloa humidicola]
MATSKPLLAVLLLLLSLLAASASASTISDADIPLPFTLLPSATAGGCRGTVGECLAGDDADELGLGHHHGRALYGSSKYISYHALQGDNVPCSRRGDSYYNCRPSGAANPYSRGCSRITRCRG